jgi:hypothetical protein
MLLFLAFLACGHDSTIAKQDEVSSSNWRAGQFDFYTETAKDGCLGGAMEALFMPEGPDTRHEFEYPIYLPSFDELPTSYTVDLRDPFVSMPVTVEQGQDGEFEIRGSVMTDVELGASAYGDCVVTMTVDADLAPTDADTAVGTAWIEISDPISEEGRCPVFDAEQCVVNLTITAERQGS